MNLVVLVAFIAAQLGAASVPDAEDVQTTGTRDVVVTVNGEGLTGSELIYLMGASADSRSGRDSPTPAGVVRAVDAILAAQYGRLLGYAMTDEQFDSLVQNLRRRYQIQSDEQFREALLRDGLNESDLRRNAERQLIANRVKFNVAESHVDIDDLRARANLVWSEDRLKELYERGLRRP